MRSLVLPALYACLAVAASQAAAAAPVGAHEGRGPANHADHDHSAAGPHGGVLLVLGKEDYHAELVLDEKKNQVTVVLLDGAAKQPVAINEPQLLVNVQGGGHARQYKLKPLYADGQISGPTAMYVTVSKPLMDDLHSHSVTAKLAVRIAGKPYSTTLHHDHQGHGHDH